MPAKKNDEVAVAEAIPNALQGFYTQSREDLDVPMDFDQAIAASALSMEDITFQGSIYEVLKDKGELVNNPFFIRAFRLVDGTMGSYALVFGIRKSDNKNFIITDGSTGIYQQLARISEDRLKGKHPTPFENVLVPNGLRVSTYYVGADGMPVKSGIITPVQASTYYLA